MTVGEHDRGRERGQRSRLLLGRQPGQTLVTDPPAQAALDDPAARQQHESALGLAELDLPQVDAVDFGRLGGPLIRILLIGVIPRNALSKSYLYFYRKALNNSRSG